MKEQFTRWLMFSSGATAVYMNEFIGIFVLFAALFVTDFITGCVASFRAGDKIESYKLRWSFVKTLCYFGTFAFTLLAGVCVNNITLFINIVKLEVYVALWIEAVSITENLLKIFPGVLFLEYIHFMLSSEWVKKLSGMTNFLKEKGEKK